MSDDILHLYIYICYYPFRYKSKSENVIKKNNHQLVAAGKSMLSI